MHRAELTEALAYGGTQAKDIFIGDMTLTTVEQILVKHHSILASVAHNLHLVLGSILV
jgi:hypothetical protein